MSVQSVHFFFYPILPAQKRTMKMQLLNLFRVCLYACTLVVLANHIKPVSLFCQKVGTNKCSLAYILPDNIASYYNIF